MAPKSAQNQTQKSSKAELKPYQVGSASWYGKQFHGKTTASGEDFDMFEFTAAHRKLPLGTFVKVTNLKNGKWIIVRVNDRGPYVGNRIMDLSYSAEEEAFRQKARQWLERNAPDGIKDRGFSLPTDVLFALNEGADLERLVETDARIAEALSSRPDARPTILLDCQFGKGPGRAPGPTRDLFQ